jgi:hypothetical protein
MADDFASATRSAGFLLQEPTAKGAVAARDGDPGRAHRTCLALAKLLCRTVNRIDPA